jgi:pimeloyl-ACP methyl ester carboxylesterase
MLLPVVLLSIPFSVLGLAASSFDRQIIGGRPCLVIPAATVDAVWRPSLVLLGGVAQSSASWDHQLPSLSRNRKVVVYECLGQGKGVEGDNYWQTNTFANVSLPFQAETFLKVIDELISKGHDDQIDIAGFSFGGRVAMATACLRPDLIRRLHLTGVGCDRSDYGHLAMESCVDVIQSDCSLRSFAWTILLATYSPKYLRQLPIKIRERFMNHICSNNTPEGLLAILQQADVTDKNDPFHVSTMGDRLGSSVTSKLCVGELDQMAPVDQVRLLGDKLGNPSIDVMPDCGHAVAVEAARSWKDSVLSFLNEP